MTATELGQLADILRSRSEAIADRWYRAIAPTSFVSLSSREIRARLAALATRAIDALLGEPFPRQEARAIGAELADLHYLHPDALSGTQEVLGQALLADLPAERSVALQPRLAVLLGALAGGYFERARGIILSEQETIRSALLAAHQRAEDALRVSEARFRAIFEAAAIGIGVADLDGGIQTANPALQRMLGYNEEELRALDVPQFTHPDDAASDWEFYRQLMEGERNHFQIEKRFFRKDGSTVWTRLTSSLVRDAAGLPQLTIGMFEDITEQKAAAETIRQLNADLERRVADRTAELTAVNRELADEIARRTQLEADQLRLLAEEQAARAEAQAALAAREEFLSVAAHELKTPITSVRGFTELALKQFARADGPDPQRVERALLTLDRESQKLSHLISQLLDVSRVDAGQLALQREPTDLARLVREAAASAQLTTDRHTLDVRAPEELVARVDPLRLEQVIGNLLSNAIKYSPRGGPIDIELLMPRPDSVVIAVRDRGIGIPIDQQARLFERFYQARSGDRVAGMGLGLYISRQIVTLHGGHIDIESPPEGGTRFIVTLPFDPATREEKPET
jgi:PAS domain S-box-containing protein